MEEEEDEYKHHHQQQKQRGRGQREKNEEGSGVSKREICEKEICDMSSCTEMSPSVIDITEESLESSMRRLTVLRSICLSLSCLMLC